MDPVAGLRGSQIQRRGGLGRHQRRLAAAVAAPWGWRHGFLQGKRWGGEGHPEEAEKGEKMDMAGSGRTWREAAPASSSGSAVHASDRGTVETKQRLGAGLGAGFGKGSRGQRRAGARGTETEGRDCSGGRRPWRGRERIARVAGEEEMERWGAEEVRPGPLLRQGRNARSGAGGARLWEQGDRARCGCGWWRRKGTRGWRWESGRGD